MCLVKITVHITTCGGSDAVPQFCKPPCGPDRRKFQELAPAGEGPDGVLPVCKICKKIDQRYCEQLCRLRGTKVLSKYYSPRETSHGPYEGLLNTMMDLKRFWHREQEKTIGYWKVAENSSGKWDDEQRKKVDDYVARIEEEIAYDTENDTPSPPPPKVSFNRRKKGSSGPGQSSVLRF